MATKATVSPAKKKSPLRDTFERNQYDLQGAFRRSRDWYNQQVLLLNRQRITPNQVIDRSPKSDMKKRIYPGSLYMFMYDPKTKKDLPFYDTFPMVFPWRTAPGGFIGLNLHYLPHQLRLILLERLFEYRTNDRMDETTRLKYSWDTINGVAKFALAKPCVKRYLNRHVTSPFRKIEVNDWATAMLLPVERFKKASKEEVWKDSLSKI